MKTTAPRLKCKDSLWQAPGKSSEKRFLEEKKELVRAHMKLIEGKENVGSA